MWKAQKLGETFEYLDLAIAVKGKTESHAKRWGMFLGYATMYAKESSRDSYSVTSDLIQGMRNVNLLYEWRGQTVMTREEFLDMEDMLEKLTKDEEFKLKFIDWLYNEMTRRREVLMGRESPRRI